MLDYEKKSPVKPILVEEPFKIRVDNVHLAGRWDRVDQVKGEGIVIDYKSSQVASQKEADKKARESEQLSIYAIAYADRFGKPPVRVELRFFDSGLIGQSERDDQDLAEIQEAIRNAATGLRKLNYTATPSSYKCGNCEFADICPSAVK